MSDVVQTRQPDEVWKIVSIELNFVNNMKEIMQEIKNEDSTTADEKQMLKAIGDLEKSVDEIVVDLEKEKIVDFADYDHSTW